MSASVLFSPVQAFLLGIISVVAQPASITKMVKDNRILLIINFFPLFF